MREGEKWEELMKGGWGGREQGRGGGWEMVEMGGRKWWRWVVGNNERKRG